MFGNEIRFSELDSSEWTDIKNFNVLDFLIKLAEPKKIDLTKNMQLMDSSLIVPTCVGEYISQSIITTAFCFRSLKITYKKTATFNYFWFNYLWFYWPM